MKQKFIIRTCIVGVFLLASFGVYEVLSLTRAARTANPLINIFDLSKEFMDEFQSEYQEIATSNNKDNILIVTSETPLENYFGAQRVVSAANNRYFLEYASEEEKKLAYEQISHTPDLAVSENYVRELFDDNASDGEYNSWGIEKMGLSHASKLVEDLDNKNEVIVAIADTGLDMDLFLENYPEAKLAGSYSVTSPDYEMDDEVGHGTHIAGTIAEGTPSNVKIYPVQLSNSRSVYSTDIIAAIDYIVYYTDADVLNMSFGGYQYSDAEYLSIEAAKEKGIINIAAAGNEATNEQSFPASFDNTISVAAVDQNLNFASEFSNFGSTIDFSAPGVEIKSINDTYDGTSMAAPHVAAAAAIAKSLKDDFNLESMKQFLTTRAIDLGPSGRDNKYGYGFIDYNNAKICTSESEICDEFSIFETEIEEGIEIDEVVLTPYNYGSLTNLLATTIRINNQSGSYTVKTLGDFGTKVDILGYDPYATGEQEVAIQYGDLSTSFTVTNPDEWESGWVYQTRSWDDMGVEPETRRLTKYKDHGMNIKTLYLPETIDGMEVSGLGMCPFNNSLDDGWSSCDGTDSEDSKHYETIILPSTYSYVQGINGSWGGDRFQNLYLIVSLADEITVGSHAFQGLRSLTRIDANILFEKTYMGWNSTDGYYGDARYANGVFQGDILLEEITLSENNEIIPDTTFSECTSLETVELPDSITEIGQQAFVRAGIKAINLENVQKLGQEAFWYSDIEAVNIPAGLTEIGMGAFAATEKLESITVDQENPIYDSRDNSNAIIRTSDNTLLVGISSTVIPASVKTIGENAFGQASMDEITIPEGVETIEAYGFKDCFYLQKVVMSRSLTTIDDNAFSQTGTAMPSRTIFWIWSDSYAKEWVFERDLPYVLMDDLGEKEPRLIADATFEVIPEGRDFYAFDTFSPENFIIKVFYWDKEAEKVVEEPEIVTDYTVIYNDGNSESLNGGYNDVRFVFDTSEGHKNIKIDLGIGVKYLSAEYEVPTGVWAYSGQALAEVELPQGFTWMNAEEFVREEKTEYLGRFTPEDSEHYKVVDNIAIPVEVRSGTTFVEIFPDSELRACIIRNLNERDGAEYTEETVDLNEVLSMTELSCANTGDEEEITNARGIEKMVDLVSLDLANNSIERINLSNNSQLENLNLRGNQVRQLDISNNPNISELLIDGEGLLDGEYPVIKTATYLKMYYPEDGSTPKVVMDISGLEFLKDADWSIVGQEASYDENTGLVEWEGGEVFSLMIAVNLDSGETITYSIYGFPRRLYITTVLDDKVFDEGLNIFYSYTDAELELNSIAKEILLFYGLSNYVLEDVTIKDREEPRNYTVGTSDMDVTFYFRTKEKKETEPTDPGTTDEPDPADQGDDITKPEETDPTDPGTTDEPDPADQGDDIADSEEAIDTPETGAFTAVGTETEAEDKAMALAFYIMIVSTALLIVLTLSRARRKK